MADTTETFGDTPSPAKPRKAAAAKVTTAKSASNKPTADTGASFSDSTGGTNASAPRAEARSRFNAAIEEAKAGVEALKSEAVQRTTAYRAKATAKVEEGTADWVGEAKAMGEDAKQRGAKLAQDGKSRASDGLAALGKTVSDNATLIDEKLGVQYGDYARTAARTMQETAAKLDSKDFAELGDDAREFVRNSPGAAIGIAAVAGFFIAKLFKGSND